MERSQWTMEGSRNVGWNKGKKLGRVRVRKKEDKEKGREGIKEGTKQWRLKEEREGGKGGLLWTPYSVILFQALKGYAILQDEQKYYGKFKISGLTEYTKNKVRLIQN